MYDLRPVGFIRSCFKFKNGTPRQPGICTASQASLTISKDIYNNPEHSLLGLEEFSHVWILFIFHKNNNTYDKAKVKPPRLNGAKVGVFSTRSPYRLNPIGLTLAKIERTEGDTLYLSGVDMLDGTPVVDIKPYISTYDQPLVVGTVQDISPPDKTIARDASETSEITSKSAVPSVWDNSRVNDSDVLKRNNSLCENSNNVESNESHVDLASQGDTDMRRVNQCTSRRGDKTCDITNSAVSDPVLSASCDQDECYERGNKSCNSNKEISSTFATDNEKSHLHDNSAQGDERGGDKINLVKSKSELSRTADWIAEPPIPKLRVRFTPSAADQLRKFSSQADDENFKLKYITDAETAIKTILQADPRSTYRRTKCNDRLYFCAVDCVHVTAWFNDDENIAEVLRVKPFADANLLPSQES